VTNEKIYKVKKAGFVMLNLIDRLRVMTGRKLSDADMKRAETEKEEHLPGALGPSDYAGPMTNIFRDADGKIVKVRVEYTFAETPDASEGYRLIHSNYYMTKSTRSFYDNEGFLTEKCISSCLPFGGSNGQKEFTYLPSGSFRWHTKKVTRV
jgi:hypothetical protein